MKIGIMQPYFFPYPGYFDLIYNVDEWIVFDTPQYIWHGWVNRNRILHQSRGWKYITVPVKKQPLATPIYQTQISDDKDWKNSIIRQLEHYKKSAPFYKETVGFVEKGFQYSENFISRINTHLLRQVCEYLDIPFKYSVFSEMNLNIGPVEKSGDWALRICEALGGDVYINPPGGRDLYDSEEFQRHGIKLIIREFENMVYPTGPYQFEPALSIIDVLMWNSPQAIRDYLESKRIK